MSTTKAPYGRRKAGLQLDDIIGSLRGDGSLHETDGTPESTIRPWRFFTAVSPMPAADGLGSSLERRLRTQFDFD